MFTRPSEPKKKDVAMPWIVRLAAEGLDAAGFEVELLGEDVFEVELLFLDQSPLATKLWELMCFYMLLLR
jgi:hypothetical protein